MDINLWLSTVIATLSSLLYGALEALISFFPKSKIYKTFEYRKSWKQHLDTLQRNSAQPLLWIHGASLGELEDLAAFFLNPELLQIAGYHFQSLIITSSSVSAKKRLEEWQKQKKCLYAGALPPEKSNDLKLFFESFRPDQLLLSQKDIWPLALLFSKRFLRKGITWYPEGAPSTDGLVRIFLLPQLRRLALRNKKYFPPHMTPLGGASHAASVKEVGHLRIDRILERIAKISASPTPASPNLRMIVGSAWPEDISVLAAGLKGLSLELEIDVIPHEMSDTKNLEKMRELVPTAKLILEEGRLLESYGSYDIAWVGGGFLTGLHNILEPALWGLPLLCGPHTKKQSFAPTLESNGQLKVIKNADDVTQLFSKLSKNSEEFKTWQDQSRQSQKILQENQGAARRLAVYLSEGA